MIIIMFFFLEIVVKPFKEWFKYAFRPIFGADSVQFARQMSKVVL